MNRSLQQQVPSFTGERSKLSNIYIHTGIYSVVISSEMASSKRCLVVTTLQKNLIFKAKYDIKMRINQLDD